MWLTLGLQGLQTHLVVIFLVSNLKSNYLEDNHEPTIEYLAIIVEKAKWKPLKLLPTLENIVHLKQYSFPGVMSEVTFTVKKTKKKIKARAVFTIIISPFTSPASGKK